MNGQSPEPGLGRGPTRRYRFLRYRIWIYLAVVAALLGFRGVPAIREFLAERQPRDSGNVLTLAGLDQAPVLIPRIVDAYRRLYPEIEFRIHGGGTRQALEELFNRRADVAFTTRLMTEEETAIVRGIGDTALSFPIALGGIAVVAAHGAPFQAIPASRLRLALTGGPADLGSGGEKVERLYAADPNLGLWTALAHQLEIPEEPVLPVTWLAGDKEVIQAVSADRRAIGFASTLSLPPDLDRLGARAIPVSLDTDAPAARLTEGAVAGGEYPLYHYLYVSCRPGGGAIASGFVSFMQSGRGQRLVEREGFLPARAVPREIILTRTLTPQVG